MNNMSGLPPPPYPGYSTPQQQQPQQQPQQQGPQMGSAPPSPFHIQQQQHMHQQQLQQPSQQQQSQPQQGPPGHHIMTPPQKTPGDIEVDKQKLRFQVELEFVQCLGNPNYLNFLAQRGYFKEPSFVNYLKYLSYWRTHPYVKFIKYPVCLHFLELLQHEAFRKEIVNSQCAKFLDDQTILHWQHYNRKRIKLVETAVNGGAQSASRTPQSQINK